MSAILPPKQRAWPFLIALGVGFVVMILVHFTWTQILEDESFRYPILETIFKGLRGLAIAVQFLSLIVFVPLACYDFWCIQRHRDNPVDPKWAQRSVSWVMEWTFCSLAAVCGVGWVIHSFKEAQEERQRESNWQATLEYNARAAKLKAAGYEDSDDYIEHPNFFAAQRFSFMLKDYIESGGRTDALENQEVLSSEILPPGQIPRWVAPVPVAFESRAPRGFWTKNREYKIGLVSYGGSDLFVLILPKFDRDEFVDYFRQHQTLLRNDEPAITLVKKDEVAPNSGGFMERFEVYTEEQLRGEMTIQYANPGVRVWFMGNGKVWARDELGGTH